jgi:hypothetical protein
MFFTFNQNNSGGSFDFDVDSGITHIVVIEAATKELALEKAVGIGIYFNGCETGKDCECCGDRWHEPWDDGSDAPEIYGQAIGDYVDGASILWMGKGKEACIHYKDGTKFWY